MREPTYFDARTCSSVDCKKATTVPWVLALDTHPVVASSINGMNAGVVDRMFFINGPKQAMEAHDVGR